MKLDGIDHFQLKVPAGVERIDEAKVAIVGFDVLELPWKLSGK